MHPLMLGSFIEMLPRLRADDTIQQAQAALYGNGFLKGETRQRLWNAWRAQSLGMTSGDRRTHDSHGRLILRTSGDVRRWFGLGNHRV